MWGKFRSMEADACCTFGRLHDRIPRGVGGDGEVKFSPIRQPHALKWPSGPLLKGARKRSESEPTSQKIWGSLFVYLNESLEGRLPGLGLRSGRNFNSASSARHSVQSSSKLLIFENFANPKSGNRPVCNSLKRSQSGPKDASGPLSDYFGLILMSCRGAELRTWGG